MIVEVSTDLVKAASRVTRYCRWKAGRLVAYDQTEDALDALYELDLAVANTPSRSENQHQGEQR